MNKQIVKEIAKAIDDIVKSIIKTINKIFDKICEIFKSLTGRYNDSVKINYIKYKSNKNTVFYKLNSQVIDRKPNCIRCRNYC